MNNKSNIETKDDIVRELSMTESIGLIKRQLLLTISSNIINNNKIMIFDIALTQIL